MKGMGIDLLFSYKLTFFSQMNDWRNMVVVTSLFVVVHQPNCQLDPQNMQGQILFYCA